jgi:hypothetical protein
VVVALECSFYSIYAVTFDTTGRQATTDVRRSYLEYLQRYVIQLLLSAGELSVSGEMLVDPCYLQQAEKG